MLRDLVKAPALQDMALGPASLAAHLPSTPASARSKASAGLRRAFRSPVAAQASSADRKFVGVERHATPQQVGRSIPPHAASLAAEAQLLEAAPGSSSSGGRAAEQQNPLAALLAAYDSALAAVPVRTKALTSFAGFALGDAVAQHLQGGPFDVYRCLRLALYGLCLDGPLGHAWYRLLDRAVLPEAPTSTPAVLAKTAADQLLWGPAMCCLFFVFLKTLEGHPELALPTIQAMLLKTMLANYVLWPAAHFVNFKYVPSEWRILYNNIVSVAWNAYLSWTCGGGGVGVLDLAPSDLAGAGVDDVWLAAVPCAHKLQHAGAGLASFKLLEEARQAAGFEHIIASWGWQGLLSTPGDLRLLQHYVELKTHLMQQVCGVPTHTIPHK